MIGIDIVDLEDPLFNKRASVDLRFISHENDVVNHPSSEITYWTSWVCKEATFKAYRNLNKFNPKEIVIQVQFQKDKATGYGSISGETFELECRIAKTHIFAVVVPQKKAYHYELFPVQNNLSLQKQVVRTKLIQAIKELNYDIPDNFGYQTIPHISFSHHHHYGAYAFVRDKTLYSGS